MRTLLLFACGLFAVSAFGQDVRIHRHTNPGFASVNSFLLETPNAVVLIDSQRVLSQGTEVVAKIQRLGKPLVAVLLTHPHPDHFGGLASILKEYPDTPVYASPATLEEMRTDGSGFMQATREAAPHDTPDVFPLPTHTFEDGETLEFDGVDVIVDDIGAGESKAMTAFYVPDLNSLFIGDVVAYKMMGFMLEARTAMWIAQIRQIIGDYSDRQPQTYPGHGEPGEFSELLTWQLGQLLIVRELVQEAVLEGGLPDAERSRIKLELERLFPGHPYVAEIPILLELNIDAVASEVATAE